jgi:hypothetical protein
MDFFQAIQELEDYIMEEPSPSWQTQKEVLSEFVSEDDISLYTHESGPASDSLVLPKKRRSKRKRIIGPKRALNNADRKRQDYYHDLHRKRHEYYEAARSYAMNGGETNFIYGADTPEELRRFEGDKVGIPFLHTCVKNLPTFRFLIHKGADVFVSDIYGKTVRDMHLRGDVRKYLHENKVFTANDETMDKVRERIKRQPIKRGFAKKRR